MSKSIGHEITLKVYVLLNEKFQRNASKVPTYFYLLEYVNTEKSVQLSKLHTMSQ